MARSTKYISKSYLLKGLIYMQNSDKKVFLVSSIRKWVYISLIFGFISLGAIYTVPKSRTNAYLYSSIQIKETFKEDGLVVKPPNKDDEQDNIKKHVNKQLDKELKNQDDDLDIDLESNSQDVKQGNELDNTITDFSSLDKDDKANSLDDYSIDLDQQNNSIIQSDHVE